MRDYKAFRENDNLTWYFHIILVKDIFIYVYMFYDKYNRTSTPCREGLLLIFHVIEVYSLITITKALCE